MKTKVNHRTVYHLLENFTHSRFFSKEKTTGKHQNLSAHIPDILHAKSAEPDLQQHMVVAGLVKAQSQSILLHFLRRGNIYHQNEWEFTF